MRMRWCSSTMKSASAEEPGVAGKINMSKTLEGTSAHHLRDITSQWDQVVDSATRITQVCRIARGCIKTTTAGLSGIEFGQFSQCDVSIPYKISTNKNNEPCSSFLLRRGLVRIVGELVDDAALILSSKITRNQPVFLASVGAQEKKERRMHSLLLLEAKRWR
ncbi:hypothetical protein BHE74_00058368 [Ensete ventricosum]|nr:hypothetical protein BHE74_00058368 [Ensete ventricosum]